MTYDKQTWANGESGGTPLSASRLNHMEDGIEAADDAAAAASAAIAAHVADANPHPQYTVPTDYVPQARTITAGTGLTGGGTLAADRSLSVDPNYVKGVISSSLAAGSGISLSTNSGTTTITASTDAESVRDTVASTLLAGSGIGIVVDDAGNTITISNTSGSAAYNVDIFPVDSTGTIAMDSQIATAIASVNSLYNSSRGAHTVSLRFAPGNFRITNPNIFDALTVSTASRRGLTICGPTEVGKRATMLIFDSTVTSSTDQTQGCLFRLVNQRQFTFRDIGFKSNNPNQTLFYLHCTFGSDEGSVYPEFTASTAQNSGRWRRIYVEGDWKVIWGVDGGVRANLNSEMAFEDWTFSNSLTVSDCVFKFGYPLRDAVFLSTGISAPTAGTFTLTYNGQTTTSLAYNASAASIKSALEALSTIGTGNVQVTASSTPTAGSYVIKFVGAMAGAVDTSLMSTTTSGWSGVSWKVFRFPPQQGQFLNYAFRNNEWEYARGDLFQINRGGCISLEGYHSVIIGVGGGTNGGTMFVMPEVPTHPDDCCKLYIGGIFRGELRTQYAKFMDCSWYGVNKHIHCDNVAISITAISGGGTGSTVKAMEVMAFRNKINSQQAFVKFSRCDFPGYITIENATTGASGGVIMLEQCRFKSWTTYSAALFANQAALEADTAAAIRVLGSAKIEHKNNTTNGGVAISDGVVSL